MDERKPTNQALENKTNREHFKRERFYTFFGNLYKNKKVPMHNKKLQKSFTKY